MAVLNGGMTLYANQDTQESWSGTDDLDDYNNAIQGTNSESWNVAKNGTETGVMSKSANMVGAKYFTNYTSSNLTNAYTSIKTEVESSANNFESFTVADTTNRDVTGEFHPTVLQFGQGSTTGTLDLSAVSSLRVIIDNSASGNIRAVINNWIDTMWYGSGRTISGSTVSDKLFAESHTLDTTTNDNYDGCSEKFKSGIAYYTDVELNTTLGNSFSESITWAYQRNTDNNYTIKVTGTSEFKASNYVASDDGTGVTLNLDTSLSTLWGMGGGSLVGAGTTVFKVGQNVKGVVFTNRTSLTHNGANFENNTINTSGSTTVLSTGTFANNTFNKPTSTAVIATTLNDLDKNTFNSSGTLHAVNLGTISSTQSMNWDNFESGYTASSSGNETILVSVDSGITLTINVISGASTPSVYNTGLGTVTIVTASVPIKVTVNAGGSLYADASVYLKLISGDGGTVILNGVTDDLGVLATSYSGTTPVTIDSDISEVRSSSGSTPYQNYTLSGQITSNGYDVTAILSED